MGGVVGGKVLTRFKLSGRKADTCTSLQRCHEKEKKHTREYTDGIRYNNDNVY